MSNIKVNTINDASGGSAAVLYGVASPPNSMGFRNRLINSDMRIDQRNAGASAGTASGTFAYFLDRWVASYSQTSKFTVQQNAGGVTAPAGFTNYLGVTSSSAYAVLAGDTFNMQQPIEGFNVADLGWGAAGAQAVTVSFWVRSSLTGTFGGAACNSNLTRSYPFTFSISAANTWEYKTVVIQGDTSGTWVTNNGVGLRLYFNLGAGSTYSGTAGAWAGANYQSATGATSVVGTNGATFYITGVQLEAGTVATPFERRDYGRELQLCERYYEVISSGDISGGAYSAGNLFAGVRFRTVKRANPTMTSNANGSWVGNGGNGALNSVAFSGIGLYGCQIDSTSFTGSVTQGYAYNFRSFDYRASAEL